MGLLKVILLVKMVIIIGSCESGENKSVINKNESDTTTNQKSNLKLVFTDDRGKEIVVANETNFTYSESESEYRLQFLDSAKVFEIEQMRFPKLVLSTKGTDLPVGSMIVTQANLPEKFDYFFSIYENGKAVIYSDDIFVIMKRKGIVSNEEAPGG